MIKTKKLCLPKLRPKVIILFIILFILGIVGGYIAFLVYRPVDSSDIDIQDGVKTLPKTKTVSQQQQGQDVASPVSDIAKVYPFILTDAATGTAVNSTSGIQNNMPMSLPAIPNYQPRPSGLPMPSLPPIPGSGYIPPQNFVPKSENAAIQGVFIGNNGSNMAIMSDGKVVKEGDAYGDSRIAVIGGDGIQLDNGNAISYGIRKGE